MQSFKEFVFTALTGALSASCLSFNSGDFFESAKEPAFYIEPSDSFMEVVEYMSHYLQAEQMALQVEEEPLDAPINTPIKRLTLDIALSDDGIKCTPRQAASKKAARNYMVPVSSSEKEKMRYIIKTLGYESIVKITSETSNLKKVGKQINHLHPLRFLMTIFTDEELKAGIHAIRGRSISWIWSNFLDGIKGSLSEETANQNMRIEYIQDFANSVGINIQLILPSLQNGKWEEFVNILIDNIPRKTDPNRYDM
jgi:hypothetical protein